ncbi:Thymidylate synthase ThyX [Chlamydia avium]|uniref:UPF0159 protein n=1 Tax=Chlamydia avium 10DC88 TaxID=1229831 RepID=W8K1E3_9CHLA|nr:FAD-dependent thymidylate synthase [Chlamydia avium]AHK63647.1 UPF0159 protein [Chlamydia avium 10DC88]VVT43232.1 Thymidylate synthase ThyX [Chlamydia avium]
MLSRDEEFSTEQKKSLSHFVTNLEKNIFALKNLPEVVKGALFSKYSRSTLGLRSLLLKEFLEGEGGSFLDSPGEDFEIGVQKASDFYRRVLDGFGDDSIGELGGAHLAIEGISMLAAKVLENARIGGSPLEKSSRYVYFDQKVKGEYLYYRDPILMTSAFKDVFLDACDFLFDTYADLIPKVRCYFEKIYPREVEVSQSAYSISLRAKVLDCLRGLLPAATLTNLGFFGNGRFWQTLLHKLQCHNLTEVRQIGESSLTELMKIIPSFISRAESHHHHHQAMCNYWQVLKKQLVSLSEKYGADLPVSKNEGVRLVYGDPEGIYKVAAGFLFPYSEHTYSDLINICRSLPQEDLTSILEAGAFVRENRRHKSPRGLECLEFGFDITADFGAYRDLQRHRTLTQERQLLTTKLGYHIPQSLIDTPMEKDYREAMEKAENAYNQIAGEFPEEAQYVVPLAYNIRWLFHINGRSLQWLCELRSQVQGHENYRKIAIDMAKEVIKFNPAYETFFKFVDYSECDLGRIQQESRKNL